jgi:outer membrane murein-binding lipoprotein Lpp
MGKQFLLTSTALVASIALATSAQAGGRTQEQNNDQQIQELNARVDALEAELQNTQVSAQKDREAAAAALKKADGWWQDTKISGRMYYNLTNVDNTHNGFDDAKNGFSFDFKRFYISVDHKFNDMFSADLTTDANYKSQTGEVEVFVKKAYLQAKIADELTVRIGATDMPWIPFAEGAYGYRHIEQTVVDRTKFGASSDWGVHFMGDLMGKTLGYQISVVNGNGYRNPTRADGMDVEGRINLNISDFTVAVGGYYGQLGAVHGTTTFNDATRLNALIAYKKDGLRAGFEYFVANDYAFVTAPGSSKGEGYSAFASYEFDPLWSVFGKYENVTPYDEYSTSIARENFENTYYNVGIQYSPTKIVDFALVYKHDAGDNGFFSDGLGTIGGTAFAPGNDGDYDEIGLYGQLRW